MASRQRGLRKASTYAWWSGVDLENSRRGAFCLNPGPVNVVVMSVSQSNASERYRIGFGFDHQAGNPAGGS